MKICYVANSRFPSERAHMTQIVQMCNAFSECGHNVTLLVTDRKSSITEDPELFFGVKFKFKFIRICVPDVAGNIYRIPNFLRSFVFLLQRFVFAIRAKKYIYSQGFEYVYGRDEWILFFLSFFFKRKIIWESHEARYSFVAKKVFITAEAVIVISEGIKNFYSAKNVPKEKILVAHDAVDDRFFAPHISRDLARESLGIVSEKPVVMYIGGLEEWKGSRTFFDASQNQPEFESYVIGGKSEEIDILRDIYPNIHFLGPRPYRELPQHQQAADILVIPNTAKIPLSAEYTSPLKLFTYMTSKKPIIASEISSITNVLSSDESFFCIADDSDSLQTMIKYVIAHKELAKTYAQNAYKKSSMFTWKNRAKSILNFINNNSV